jgi:hypothetical protein
METMVYANIHCRTKNRSIAGGLVSSSLSHFLAVSFLVLNACCFHITNDSIGKVDAYNVVRVCQNKHCCKRANGNVLQTMHNLIDTAGDDNVVVEASGCLSQCDNGPNVEITTGSGTVLLHEMMDAQTCAFQLGELSSFPPLPKILIAASKVIEQSRRFAANGQLEEEVRFLTSVIDKLESSPVIPPATSANADAHALRAEARLQLVRKETEKASRDVAISAVIRDAQRVVQDLSAVATPASLSSAYRTWTDAELKKGDCSMAVAVLTEWHRAQPIYRTKLQGEIQGLLS